MREKSRTVIHPLVSASYGTAPDATDAAVPDPGPERASVTFSIVACVVFAAAVAAVEGFAWERAAPIVDAVFTWNLLELTRGE